MRAKRSWTRGLILYSGLVRWKLYDIVIWLLLLEFKLSFIASDSKWSLVWLFITFLCRTDESITCVDHEIRYRPWLLAALSQLSSKGLTASTCTCFTSNCRMLLLELRCSFSRGNCHVGNHHGRVIAVKHDRSLQWIWLLLCLTTNPHYCFLVIIYSCWCRAIKEIWDHIGLFISDSSLIIVS